MESLKESLCEVSMGMPREADEGTMLNKLME